jgi:hypothetical protein
MNTVSSPCDLDIDVQRQEVYRNLGYRRRRRPRAGIEQRIDELWPRAIEWLSPRGVMRVVDRASIEPTGMPSPTDEVGIGLCTIGPDLEDEVQRHNERGEMLDALLLDAIGSAAAEAAADAVNRLLCAEAARRGRYAAPRISPGYGRWDVAAQAELLGLLPAAEVGIHLTTGMMMIPRKSVSFAVRFDKQPPAPETRRRRCERCQLQHCPYRYDPDEDDSGTTVET